MIEYKNELRIAAHVRKGTVRLPDLNPTPGYESPLDNEIIACAGNCLKGQKLLAFFWAYHCAHSWSDIQLNFARHLKSELDQKTVERYARDAATRILEKLNSGKAKVTGISVGLLIAE